MENNIVENLLDDNDILMYSSHNKGRSVIAERFCKNLKG